MDKHFCSTTLFYSSTFQLSINMKVFTVTSSWAIPVFNAIMKGQPEGIILK